MQLLAQFLLRLSFGLAVGMAIVSPRQVASDFFRNHLYVTLGLSTLAALVSYTVVPEAFWYAVGTAAASYIGSVCWLYEKKESGRTVLLIVALLALLGTLAFLDSTTPSFHGDRYFPPAQANQVDSGPAAMGQRALHMGQARGTLMILSNISSGLLLGTTLAAMFLGHWYLNSPTMQLAPLRRLLLAMAVALLLQGLMSVVGLALELHFATDFSTYSQWFLALRWLFGLIGVAVLTWMAWRTLAIPNTQSATGILYVAVIGVFVGELAAALLSAEGAFPL